MKDLKFLKNEGLQVYINYKRLYSDYRSTANILKHLIFSKNVTPEEYDTILLSKREAYEQGVNKSLIEKGGYTSIEIFDSNDNFLAEATAYCSPNEQFCKVIGRNIAIGRALKKINQNEI